MYRKSPSFFLILFFYIFQYLYIKPLKGEEIKRIDSVLFGVYEKGYQLGTQFKLNKSSTLLFKINYLNLPIGDYDVGLSNQIPFNLYNRSFQLEYLKYFNTNINKTGNFISLGIELSKLKARSRIKLSDLKFDLNPLTITCSTCNDYLFDSSNDLNFIPRIAFGRQYKLSSKLFLKTSLGVQYLSLPAFSGKYESEDPLPFYVREEVSEVESLINDNVNNLPKIYPTINISFIYKI